MTRLSDKTDPRLGQVEGYELRACPQDTQRVDAFIPSPCIQNHAANLHVLADGTVLCVWFGGTQEGIADISVYCSRLPPKATAWTMPVRLSDDPTRSEQNPILFEAPDATLWLIWTAQIAGNQDTAFIRRRLSKDGGQSWGEIETLFDAVGSSGVFVRQPPITLKNGDLLLPLWYCHSRPGERWVGNYDTSAVRISSDHGKSWSEYEVPGSLGCVHMGCEQLADGSLLALFRSRWADSIYESRSYDNGRTWSEPVTGSLPNNNSSIQFTTLRDHRLALVFNDISAKDSSDRRASLYDDLGDDESGRVDPVARAGEKTAIWGVPRAPMTLAISPDDGKSWVKRNLEIGDGYCLTNNSKDGLNREFSYPSIKQGPEGSLHIAYTYHRRLIKYVRLPPDWISLTS